MSAQLKFSACDFTEVLRCWQSCWLVLDWTRNSININFIHLLVSVCLFNVTIHFRKEMWNRIRFTSIAPSQLNHPGVGRYDDLSRLMSRLDANIWGDGFRSTQSGVGKETNRIHKPNRPGHWKCDRSADTAPRMHCKLWTLF